MPMPRGHISISRKHTLKDTIAMAMSHVISVQIRCGIVYNCIPKSWARVTLVHVHVLRQSFIMLIQLFLWHSHGNTKGCHAKLCKLKFPIRDQEHRISPGFTFGHLVKCHNRSDLCSENSGRLTNGGCFSNSKIDLRWTWTMAGHPCNLLLLSLVSQGMSQTYTWFKFVDTSLLKDKTLSKDYNFEGFFLLIQVQLKFNLSLYENAHTHTRAPTHTRKHTHTHKNSSSI